MPDYGYVDQPFFWQYLFYPRKDYREGPAGSESFFVEVEANVNISCRLYHGQNAWPWIIYFHGNGEVVSDYDDIAFLYHAQSINLAVVDYRGYGASQGEPGFASIVADAGKALAEIILHLQKQGIYPEVWVMGRSMGSMCALQIAFLEPSRIKGIVIESGFTSVSRLITHLGLAESNPALDRLEEQCLQMIRSISVPALLLHGSRDNLVPLREGELIYETLGSTEKKLVVIPEADHNDIIFRDVPLYFGALKQFVSGTGKR